MLTECLNLEISINGKVFTLQYIRNIISLRKLVQNKLFLSHFCSNLLQSTTYRVFFVACCFLNVLDYFFPLNKDQLFLFVVISIYEIIRVLNGVSKQKNWRKREKILYPLSVHFSRKSLRRIERADYSLC